MHLVFLNQYYPPDVAPTGVMLEAVAEELVRQGHEVTVICAEGGYAGTRHKTSRHKTRVEALPNPQSPMFNLQGPISGSCVLRLVRIRATRFGRGTMVGKLADYASYYVGVNWKLMTMKQRPDRVVALTTPPFLSVLARILSKLRGGDHAHWVMDLYPDVMAAHGMLKETGLMYRLLTAVARWGFGGRRCVSVVTLGPDMAERVGHHVDVGQEVEWVPLWGSGNVGREAERARNLRRERGWGDDELIVMYSGNMGLGHRFSEILSAARHIAETGEIQHIRFVFYGEGKRKNEILTFAKKHPECRIEIHGYASREILSEHLQSADIHLASLDSGWVGTMIPSKLQGIFQVERSVIFVGSSRSSIWRWVLESGGGWVVQPGDVDGLVAAIREGRERSVRKGREQAAATFASLHFSKKINAKRLAMLFRSS